MTYTVINHQKRKALTLTNSEYICLDTIYHLNNNPKFKVLNKTYLADIVGISRQALAGMIKKLTSLGYLTDDEKITKQVYDILYGEIIDSIVKLNDEVDNTSEVSVKKVDIECKESGHNNNIIINKRNIISKDIIKENIYKKYIELFKTDVRYRYKAKVMLYLNDLLKEYTEDQLINSIILYHKSFKGDIKYSLSPKNFFSNSKANDKYRVFEDYIGEVKVIDDKFLGF